LFSNTFNINQYIDIIIKYNRYIEIIIKYKRYNEIIIIKYNRNNDIIRYDKIELKKERKIMETKTIVIMAIIISSTTTLLWILGLIFADINLFILAIILSIISLIFLKSTYLNQIGEFFSIRDGKVVDDERTQYIEAKSSTISFAAVVAVSIYSIIGIFTLRNVYPQYIDLAYPLIIIVVIGVIANIISKVYYTLKYSDWNNQSNDDNSDNDNNNSDNDDNNE
jgi:uncharacterized membrane protein